MLSDIDLACRKPIETMCHTLNLNKPFKSYISKIYVAAVLDSRFLCTSCTSLQGCPPRLCLWVYVEMISTDQHFTARHVPQTLLAPWVFGGLFDKNNSNN